MTRRKNRPAMKRFNQVQPRQPHTGGRGLVMLAPEAAADVSLGALEAHACVMSCVRLVAETIGSLSAHVYRRLPGGSRQVAHDHPLYWLLHSEPNPEMCAMGFWEAVVAHMLLRGNSYAEVVRSRDGREVKALYPVDPDRCCVVRADDGAIWYHFADNPGPKYLPPAELLHVPAFGFDGLVGYDPLTIIRRSAALSIAAEQFGAGFFRNNAQLGAVLSSDKPLSQPRDQELRELLRQHHAGARNAFRYLFLPTGVKYEAVGVSPENGQYLETRKFQRAEIAGWFRVPLYLLNDLERATFNNVEEMGIGFVRHCLRPLCEKIEQSVNRRLFGPGDHYFEFDLSSLLRGNSQARAAWYREMFGIGVYSVNDIRAKENENGIGPAGDLHFVNSALVPLERIAAGGSPDERPASDRGDIPSP